MYNYHKHSELPIYNLSSSYHLVLVYYFISEKETFVPVTFISYLFDSTSCPLTMLFALQYTSLPLSSSMPVYFSTEMVFMRKLDTFCIEEVMWLVISEFPLNQVIFAGGRQSFVKQVMFILLPSMTADCNGNRVTVDTGTVRREKNRYVYWSEG